MRPVTFPKPDDNSIPVGRIEPNIDMVYAKHKKTDKLSGFLIFNFKTNSYTIHHDTNSVKVSDTGANSLQPWMESHSTIYDFFVL